METTRWLRNMTPAEEFYYIQAALLVRKEYMLSRAEQVSQVFMQMCVKSGV